MLYLGNPEDLGNGVGDFFGHEVIQIPNIETVFESITAKITFKLNRNSDHSRSGVNNHVPLYNLKQTFKSSDASVDTKLLSGNRASIVKRVFYKIMNLGTFFRVECCEIGRYGLRNG